MIVSGFSYWNLGFGLEPGAVENVEEAKGTMVAWARIWPG
jgi:hypothetical protein